MPDHIADANKKVQPAPEPLPGVVEDALNYLAGYNPRGGYMSPDKAKRVDAITTHISDLTRRLAELENPVTFFCVHCRAEFPASADGIKGGMEHDLTCPKNPLVRRLAEAEAELAEIEKIEPLEPKHFGLRLSRRISAKIVYLNSLCTLAVARAEAAEARVRELEAIVLRVEPDASDDTTCGIDNEHCPTPELKCHYCPKRIEKDKRAAEAEAFRVRVMAWARNDCTRCGFTKPCRDCAGNPDNIGGDDNWTPPQAWEVGE